MRPPVNEADRLTLKKMFEQGFNDTVIGQAFGLSRAAIFHRRKNMGLLRREPKKDNTELNKMILAGYSNAEIREKLGPIGKDRLSTRRARLGMRVKQDVRSDAQDAPVSNPHFLQMRRSCPKCGSYLRGGGVISGVYAPDIQGCLICGWTNESTGFYDAHKGVREEG